ncbi:hypothetical protein HCJ57_11680 [Listeria booriae]|uniref:hypothetical protein n=1 Tax=Listeria booriae TaxID=1552123 RepID=UPI00162A0062|nr:hypothetical protein [Listeria booriae]MBC1813251.1 hypothetical protein [Listeria booriae]MBC1891970.1 hypothetical protein [Listeria booriae]MBC1898497.1 hypothetical protein [Listeria booriae]MBC2057174.1 hypothetical protein [Listeria booriae]MBC2264989.1 hypothetical protein [Listeria booriae]
MKQLSSGKKIVVILGIIALIAISISAIWLNDNLTAIITISVIQFILIQAVCYVGIYSEMKVGSARGHKLFTWGIVTTLIFMGLIYIFAADNFRQYSAAIIALLGFSSALIMREVENTHPDNKKQEQ